MPTGTAGPNPIPYGGKHTRLLYDSRRGRMVLTGGDYFNAHVSDNGSHLVWAIDLASAPTPASRRIVENIAIPREIQLPVSADFETHLAFDPVNRVLLYPNTLDFGGRVYRFGIYHVDKKRWEWEAVPTDGHPVQGNAVGFDFGNNVMMLYGGRGGSVFWLYRYGNGAEPDTPAR